MKGALTRWRFLIAVVAGAGIVTSAVRDILRQETRLGRRSRLVKTGAEAVVWGSAKGVAGLALIAWGLYRLRKGDD